MQTHEKLERLTKFMNRTAVCNAAGLSPATLINAIDRRSSIRGSTAVALARVLGVDAGWLLDDSKGWPPVRVESAETCDAA